MFPIILLIVAILAHLPIVYVYSRTMWSAGHYQFFPLLFCAVGWLMYDRLSSRKQGEFAEAENGKASLLVYGLFAANIVVLFFSVAIHTPVLVVPAIASLLCAVIVDRYGFSGLWAVVPVVGLLFIVMKLPTGRDLVLINQMQFLASQLASWILDAFGVIHFREGVILITEKKQFFTEEACSGIRSLFSSVAAVAIYGLSRHYSIVRQFFNVLQTVVWVIVGNGIRVAAVVYLSDNGYEQFAHGTIHEIFGLVIFVGILAVAFSVDKVIDIVAANRDKIDPSENVRSAEETQPNEIEGVITRPASTIRTGRSKPVTWGLIGLYLLVFLFSARLTYAKWNHFDRISFQADELIAVAQTELPELVDGWKLVDFESAEREDSSLFAPESYIWSYRRDGLSVVISLDGPYSEFHDLTLCYRGTGWDVSRHNQYSKDSQEGISWLDMTKPTEYGRVYFVAYSRDGKLAPPAHEFAPSTRVVRNIELAMGKVAAPDSNVNRNGEMLPISQIQLMVTSEAPISESDMESCRKLFEMVRAKLLQSVRFRIGS